MLTKWSANFARPHKAHLLSLTPLEFSKSGQDLFTASAFSSCWSSASILQIVRSSFLLPGDISHSGIHQKGNFSFVKNSRDTTHQVRGRESLNLLGPRTLGSWYSHLSVRSIFQLPQGEAECGGGGKKLLRVFS